MDSMVDPPTDGKIEDDAAWSDCPLTAQTLRWEMRGKRYYAVRVKTGTHECTVYVSPQGRSVRVYLDGVLMSEEPSELHDKARGLY